MNPILCTRHSQKGVTLIVAMLLLVVATAVTLSAVRFAGSEVRIALNEETRINAFQSAQSVADSLGNIATLPTATSELFCTAGIKDENGTANQDPDPNSSQACTSTAVTVPGSYLSTEIAAGKVSATVRYIRKVDIKRGRGSGTFAVSSGDSATGDELGAGSGTAIYRYYGVTGNVLRASEGLGQTQIQQGLRKLFIEGSS